LANRCNRLQENFSETISAQFDIYLPFLIPQKQNTIFPIPSAPQTATRNNLVIRCYFILEAAKRDLLPILSGDKIPNRNFSKGSTSFRIIW